MAESYFIKQQFDFWTIPSKTIYNSIINLFDQTCTLWINNMMPKTYRKFNSIHWARDHTQFTMILSAFIRSYLLLYDLICFYMLLILLRFICSYLLCMCSYLPFMCSYLLFVCSYLLCMCSYLLCMCSYCLFICSYLIYLCLPVLKLFMFACICYSRF